MEMRNLKLLTKRVTLCGAHGGLGLCSLVWTPLWPRADGGTSPLVSPYMHRRVTLVIKAGKWVCGPTWAHPTRVKTPQGTCLLGEVQIVTKKIRLCYLNHGFRVAGTIQEMRENSELYFTFSGGLTVPTIATLGIGTCRTIWLFLNCSVPDPMNVILYRLRWCCWWKLGSPASAVTTGKTEMDSLSCGVRSLFTSSILFHWPTYL